MFEKDKAIVLVHFGTTYPEAKKRTMDVLEEEIRQMYPEYRVMSAFTSEMVRRILAARRQAVPPNLNECLEELSRAGVRKVVLLLSHLLEGAEYRRLQRIAKEYRERFDRLSMSRPLLDDEASLERFAGVLEKIYPPKAGELKILMGHGTRLASDRVYRMLEKKLAAVGYPARIATLEGGDTLEKLLPALPAPEETALELIPLLYVAGDHVTNDMKENKDSFFHILTGRGYRVGAQMQGLGERRGIRALYVKKLEEAL